MTIRPSYHRILRFGRGESVSALLGISVQPERLLGAFNILSMRIFADVQTRRFARLFFRNAQTLSRFAVLFASRYSVLKQRHGSRRIVPVETARANVDFRINRIHFRRYVSVVARRQILVVERRGSANVLVHVVVPRRQSQGNDTRDIAQDILRCHSNIAVYHRIQSPGQLEQYLTRRRPWQR